VQVVLGVHGTPDRGDALVTELQATSQSSQQKQAQQQEERQPGTDQPQSEQLQQEQQQQQEGLHGSRKAGGESAEQKGGHQTQDQVLAGKLLHVPCDFSSLAGAKACADAFQVKVLFIRANVCLFVACVCVSVCECVCVQPAVFNSNL